VGAVCVRVLPHNLARVVDAKCLGVGGQGIVEGGVSPAAVEEAVGPKIAISVKPNNLTRVVDALCTGAPGSQGMVERGVDGGVRVVEEAVVATGVIDIVPDDLPRVVDARGERAFEGVRRRIVEGSVETAV
jgi:hypothetical protein